MTVEELPPFACSNIETSFGRAHLCEAGLFVSTVVEHSAGPHTIGLVIIESGRGHGYIKQFTPQDAREVAARIIAECDKLVGRPS